MNKKTKETAELIIAVVLQVAEKAYKKGWREAFDSYYSDNYRREDRDAWMERDWQKVKDKLVFGGKPQ